MEGFKAAFINEIDKLYRRKKALVIVILSLVMIVFGQLAIIGLRSGLGLRGTSSTEFPILVLSVLVNTLLPLFVALIAADIFTGEFSQNTMKLSLMRPVTRLKLYSAKVAAIGVFALANLLIVMVLSTITGFLFNASTATASGLVKVVLSYLISLLPIMVLALGIVLLANIFRSGTTVFFLSILLFILSKAVGIVFSQYSSLLITSMMGWYGLWIADPMPLGKILRLFIIMAGYAIMFFTAGFYLFDKRDL